MSGDISILHVLKVRNNMMRRILLIKNETKSTAALCLQPKQNSNFQSKNYHLLTGQLF